MRHVSTLPGFHIFTSNKDTKERIRDLVDPAAWQNIAVTYTCIDPQQIDAVLSNDINKASLREWHGIPKDGFVVLCVGQFIDRKGRWIFLDAARELKGKYPEMIFIWVAPNHLTDGENTRVVWYKLDNSLKILQSADIGSARERMSGTSPLVSTREDILSFFHIADVFALPSLVEGLPIALLEAMALGIPSISTNIYAIPEAVKHGVTGMLIEAGNAHALANAIVDLRNDCDLRDKLAENGRKYVMKNFDERVASQIAISKYRECIDNGG